ncbi:response regulator [Qipengyuania zhejiangensis]|uniref:response regulator n=1 Tax=Qipengyuania zhejiangensis TaxID=3077782 RepID=UPI002D77B2E9|nr:response regulator [Qipengyuania sp. Z2]
MAHILIVDDDELIAELAANLLIEAGHACGWVTDGHKALDLLKWRRPDLLLLDQDMPGISGGQVLRELRSSAKNYDLPVIMFTAMSGAQDEASALYNGAQEYIRKPFDDRFLLRKVDLVLRSRAETPQHRDLREVLEMNAGVRRDGPSPRRAV